MYGSSKFSRQRWYEKVFSSSKLSKILSDLLTTLGDDNSEYKRSEYTYYVVYSTLHGPWSRYVNLSVDNSVSTHLV